MSDLPFVDHHIHTVYSGHSAADMTVRALIDRAEQLGLESIAITEHAFYPLMGLSCFEQIREEVGLSDAGTKVFVGLEMDPDYKNPGRLVFEDFEKGVVSPVLVGTHAYPNTGRGWHEKLELTASEKRDIYNSWFRLMEKIVENPLVDVLAHPGRLIAQNGIIEEFDEGVLGDFGALFAGAREHGIAIELNDNAVGRFSTERLRSSYANVIALGLEMGLKVSLGSDAHSLAGIGRREHSSSLLEALRISRENVYLPPVKGKETA